MYGFDLKKMSKEEIERFHEVFDIAITLRDRHKKRRLAKMQKLVEYGRMAVRPLLYSMECYYIDTDDRGTEEMEERVSEVILNIGPEAFPVLVEEAYNGNILITVNEFAREMIWKICQKKGIAPVKSVPESEIYDFDYLEWYNEYSKKSIGGGV